MKEFLVSLTYDLELGYECPFSNMALEYESDFLLNVFMTLSFSNLSNKFQFTDSNFNCSNFNSVVPPGISGIQALL